MHPIEWPAYPFLKWNALPARDARRLNGVFKVLWSARRGRGPRDRDHSGYLVSINPAFTAQRLLAFFCVLYAALWQNLRENTRGCTGRCRYLHQVSE